MNDAIRDQAIRDRRAAIERAERAEAALTRANATFTAKRIAELEKEVAHLHVVLERAEKACPVCGAPERGKGTT